MTSHASSSNLTLSFLGGGGADANDVVTDSVGVAFLSLPLCFKLSASTTSLLWTGGAGRPLRVLFLKVPPGPEKRPPPVSLGDSGASPSSSSTLLLTFRSLDLFRLNFVSKYFMTRRTSPSLRPSVRRTDAVISGSIVSSIESLWKLKAYLSH